MREKNYRVNVDYEECYVAFIDVLGFKEKVFGEKSEDDLSFYFSTVLGFLDVLDLVDGEDDINFFVISDSIIITAPLLAAEFNGANNQCNKIKSLKKFLVSISRMQAQLALNNFWTRGGVSKGKVFIDKAKNVIAGPALVSAYRLESEIAKYPRVIVDPKIAEYCEFAMLQDFIEAVNGGRLYEYFSEPRSMNDYSSLLFDWRMLEEMNMPFDRDTHLFVDYVGSLANVNGTNLVKKIAENIILGLYKDLNYFSKYNWLKSYVSFITCYRLKCHNFNGDVLNPVRRLLQKA
ncbi:MAG: hypothetical protein HYV97_03830 [Bdellovibrio sp.]|nr:hypothetical protein [Bdellovibrio sp.]